MNKTHFVIAVLIVLGFTVVANIFGNKTSNDSTVQVEQLSDK